MKAHLLLHLVLVLEYSSDVARPNLVSLLGRQWFEIEGRGLANDLASVPGFITALRDTMRIKRGGLLWLGLPCSSQLGKGFWNEEPLNLHGLRRMYTECLFESVVHFHVDRDDAAARVHFWRHEWPGFSS